MHLVFNEQNDMFLVNRVICDLRIAIKQDFEEYSQVNRKSFLYG